MTEVVVLGPTGNVGSALLRQLLGRGVSVRTGNRQDFDYFQPRTYLPLFRGATHLFLLTPVTDQMVELTEALLQAAKKAGIRRIVRLSALGANPQSPARLLRWHGECETLLAQCGLPGVALRPNAFMQNFIQFQSHGVKATSRLTAPVGSARISFIDAEDIAKCAARVLLDEALFDTAVDLTGPESLSYREVARALSAAVGREIPYVDITEAEARAGMDRAGLPTWKAEALLELYAGYRRGEGSQLVSTGAAGNRLDRFFIQHREEFL